jgi:hypothetical protein
MSENLWQRRAVGKQRESLSYRIARETLVAVGRGGFVVLVIDGRWLLVQPRRGTTTWSEAQRQIHQHAVNERAGHILTFASAFRSDEALPDPATRELYVGDEVAGEHNLVLMALSIEKRARFLAKRLRTSGGLQLRRSDADVIAEILDILAARSLRASRTRTAA